MEMNIQSQLVIRLNRIEGQIRGIKKLIEKETYCDDILTQVASTHSALNGVGKVVLENHIKRHVVHRVQTGDIQVLDECLNMVNKLFKQ